MTTRDPAARIRRVLDSKGHAAATYWNERGRDRFRRELAEDGVADVEAVIGPIEAAMTSAMMDEMHRDLVSRRTPNV